MEIPNRQYFLETEVFNFSGGDSKSVYDKDTYIGHLKIKKGGMKIIGGTEDDNINQNREKVLDHLNDTLDNKINIDPNNIPNYYKALEGTYVRSLICPDDNDEDCQNKVDYAVKHGYKLSKLLAKKLKIKSKDYLKENAPKLYQQIKESKYWPKIKELAKKYGAKAIEYSLKSMSEMNKNGGVGTRELNSGGDSELTDTEYKKFISPGLVRNQLMKLTPRYNMDVNDIKDLILSNQTSRVSELKNAFESIENMYFNNPIDVYLKLFNSLYNYGRRNWTRNPGTTCTRSHSHDNTQSECDDYNNFVKDYAPSLYIARKKLMGYTGGYSVYNPNTGIYEDRGELGVATLNKLKRERNEESKGLSRDEFEKRKALMAYRGGDSLLNQLRFEIGR